MDNARTATLAAAHDPEPEDAWRLDSAIARRNTTWAHFEAAAELLRGAESRYAGVELVPYVRNRNDALRDWEHAIYELVRERRRYQLNRMERSA